MRTSKLILGGADGIEIIGDPYPAAGYHGSTSALHTVSLKLQNFRGLVHIEGSLLVEPGQWFGVVPPLDLPAMMPRHVSQLVPVPSPVRTNIGSASGTIAVSFRGNYSWLRVRVDRRHLVPHGMSEEAVARMVGRLDRALLLY